MQSTAALSIESLEVTYPGGARALERTSLAFDQGAVTVLLGPSGAGKSTLLRAINGLVTPTGGRVLAAGIGDALAPANLRAHRRRTAMVFQQHHLIGRLSALDNVLVGRLGFHPSLATLLPWRRAERILALQALERVGLLAFANRRADALSGGQQQRVGIARALVQRPAVLLADEPVASLDPVSAESVMQLLRGLAVDDGLAVIVSLHQVGLALAHGDRLVGMARGRVILDGAAAGLTDEAITRVYEPGQAHEAPDSFLNSGEHHEPQPIPA